MSRRKGMILLHDLCELIGTLRCVQYYYFRPLKIVGVDSFCKIVEFIIAARCPRHYVGQIWEIWQGP